MTLAVAEALTPNTPNPLIHPLDLPTDVLSDVGIFSGFMIERWVNMWLNMMIILKPYSTITWVIANVYHTPLVTPPATTTEGKTVTPTRV